MGKENTFFKRENNFVHRKSLGQVERYKEYADNYSEKTAEELDCRIENAKEQKIKS